MESKLNALLGHIVSVRGSRGTNVGPLCRDGHGGYVVDGKLQTDYFPASVVIDVEGAIITTKGYKEKYGHHLS